MSIRGGLTFCRSGEEINVNPGYTDDQHLYRYGVDSHFVHLGGGDRQSTSVSIWARCTFCQSRGELMINICVDPRWTHYFADLGLGSMINISVNLGRIHILSIQWIHDQHGEDRQSAFHYPCELLIANHLSWAGGGRLRNMQSHYIRVKHGVATSLDK